MMEIISALFMVLLVWSVGIPIFALKDNSTTGNIGLSFLLGTAFSTFSVFLSYIYIFHKITSFQILLTLILLIVIECIILLIIDKHFFRKFQLDLTLWIHHIITLLSSRSSSSAMMIMIVILFVYSLLANSIQPIFDWDALALYDFRARVIADLGTFSEKIPLPYFYQYPPYTSLLHSLIYLVDSNYSKVWYSMLYISFLLVIYSIASKKASRIVSLFLLLIISTFPSIFGHTLMAYTNLPYTIFTSLGLIYLTCWYIDKKLLGYLYSGVLLLSFSTWIRLSEPFWLLGILILIAGSWKNWKQISSIIFGVMFIILIRSTWSYYIGHFITQESGHFITLALSQSAHTLTNVSPAQYLHDLLLYIFKSVISQQSVLYAIYFFSFLYAVINKNTDLIKWWILSFLVICLFFASVILFSLTYSGWQEIADSATRVSMILVPIISVPSLLILFGHKKSVLIRKHTLTLP